MKGIKWNKTPHIDKMCWAKALSYALDKDIRDIEYTCEPLVETDNSLNSNVIDIFLQKANYMRYNVEMRLEDVLNYLDSANNEIVVVSDDHAVYITNQTIYDNVAKRDRVYQLNSVSKMVYLREKKGD